MDELSAIAAVKEILFRNSHKSLLRDLRARRGAAIIAPSFARKWYIYRRCVYKGVTNPCRTTDRSLGVTTCTDANAAQPVVRGVFLPSGSPISHKTQEARKGRRKILSTLYFFFLDASTDCLACCSNVRGALISDADYV